MKTTVALIGAGTMGNAIGLRLLATTDYHLLAFDLDHAKVQELVAKGAVAAGSAAQAAAEADTVILSLNSAAIVRKAVFGDGGVALGARVNTLIIDMSSIDPEATRSLSKEAKQKGLRWVDSPLSGGVPKVALGQLTLMVGGCEQDVAEAHSILSSLAGNITHMGPAGAGQTTKLINQVLCGLTFLAVAEATQLAIDAGVEVGRIPQALRGGRADSVILQEYMPRFLAKDYRATGRIDNMVKDLNAAQDLARVTHTAMPLTATCAEVHRLLTASGLGGEDQAVLMEYFKGTRMEKAR